jgi:PilZ domain-containing protein
MPERRAISRQRTFLKGLLTFNNGNSSEDCLVRDLSESGAQIEMPLPRAPDDFDLLLPTRGLRKRARIAWRNGVRIGLEFAPADSQPTAKPAKPPAPDDSY